VNRMRRTLSWLCASLALSCAPLTFSHQGVIDFDKYSCVRPEVSAPDYTSGSPTDYLATQLKEESGFERVITDSSVRSDLVLKVTVSVTTKSTSDAGESSEFDGVAHYIAMDSAGKVIDEGDESDTSASANEVIEDVLDQVSLHYLRPYRL